MPRGSASGLLLVLGLSLPGCDLLTGPRIELHLATIDTTEAVPIVPDTVDQGEPFTVEITIIDHCLDPGPLEQEHFPAAVILEPYQVLRSDPDVFCPGSLLFREVSGEVVWTHPFDFEVLIYAIDAWTGSPLLLRYPVVVRRSG